MKPFLRDPPKEIKDLRDMVITSAEKFGDKDIYVYKDDREEKHCTYKQLEELIAAFGAALGTLDLVGSPVAIVSETSPKVTISYLGTANTGGIAVPLDREVEPEQLINFINRAGCEAVVYSGTFTGMFTQNADKLPKVRYFIPMTGEDEVDHTLPSSPTVMLWDEVIALGKQTLEGGDNSYYTRPIDMEKCCVIIFTSGTTGTAKGVMLSMKNLVAATWASCDVTSYDSKTRLVSVLPQHHTYEMTCSHLAVINLGCTEYINESLKYVLKNFKKFKPNTLVLVPLFVETMYRKIWDEIRKKGLENKVKLAMQMANGLLAVGIDIRRKLFADILEPFGGEIVSIICGGAPINPQILKDFYTFGITIFEGYGITECAPLVACNPNGGARFGTVGKPVYGEQVKIIAEKGQKTGEIAVKGDNVMLGYFDNHEATARVFDEDGWFLTGDLGFIDGDGYIHITGRKKNMILLSNGKNIFPEELEEHLSSCPLLKESLVVGRKRENCDTVITALIYPDPELTADKTDEEIYNMVKTAVDDVNRKLPTFKHITDIEVRKEEFEKTTSKKIKRFLYD